MSHRRDLLPRSTDWHSHLITQYRGILLFFIQTVSKQVQTEKYAHNISKVRRPQNEDDEYYDEEED